MAKRPFHLAWFLSQGYGPKSWRSRWPGSDIARWMMPDLFIDLAKGMDRACFDYMIIEDSSNVPYTYKGSHDTYLQVRRQRRPSSIRPCWCPISRRRRRPRAWCRRCRSAISAVPAGAAGQHARPRDRRPDRLELRHRQQ